MKHKAYLIGMLILKLILFTSCLILWLAGLLAFRNSPGFSGWILWGGACVFTLPFDFLKHVIKGVRDGEKDGSNKYVILLSGFMQDGKAQLIFY